MKTRLIIDGNAFYEIDEECMKRKEKMEKNEAELKHIKSMETETKDNEQ